MPSAVVFDGLTVTIFRSDGSIAGSWTAISGAKGSQDPSLQNSLNLGPIPEGTYSFNVGAVQSLVNAGLSGALGPLGAGTWPGGLNSWGTERVFLTPDPGTETYGRSGFSIHGGVSPGSRGCIDLGPSEADFFEAIRGLGETNIQVVVQYDESLSAAPHPATEFVLWPGANASYLREPLNSRSAGAG